MTAHTSTRQGSPAERKERTLGLPPTVERAAMATAYEKYATAQLLHTKAHNAWRRAQRSKGDDAPATKGALTKAHNAAMHLRKAKSDYRQAKNAAMAVAA